MTEYLYKYFTDKSHMEEFITGNIRFTNLGYYKNLEEKNSSSIADKNEGDHYFSPQHEDLVITIDFPGIKQIKIKAGDLAKNPEFVFHLTPDYLNYFVFCSSIEDVAQKFTIENPCYKYYVKFDAIKFNDKFNKLMKICKQSKYQTEAHFTNGKNYFLSIIGDKWVHSHIEYYSQEFPYKKSNKHQVLRKTNKFKEQKEYRHCIYLNHLKIDDNNINNKFSKEDVDFIIQSNITINLGPIDTISYGEINL